MISYTTQKLQYINNLIRLLVAQIKEFWKKLAWPDLLGSYNFVLKVIDVSNRNRVYNTKMRYSTVQLYAGARSCSFEHEYRESSSVL